MIPERFWIGLDLGQKADYTALAVLDRVTVTRGFQPVTWDWATETRFRIRHLERARLGTAYTEIVAALQSLTGFADLAGKATLVVDATGVGAPVVEMLRRSGLRATVLPVVITSGGSSHLTHGNYHVPRTDLLAGLELLLERNRLDVAVSLPLWPVLKQELAALRRVASPDGRYRFVTAGSKTHDDLAVAAALACWAAQRASKL